jgi:hypothetical protein
MEFHAYHLPVRAATLRTVASFDGMSALVPELTPASIGDACDRLSAAQPALADMGTDRIIAAIDAAAAMLHDDASLPPLVAAFSGFSLPMAEHVVRRMTRDWRAPALHALVRAEFGSAAVLDGFAAGGPAAGVRAVAPVLGLHVFSGNVPGVAVTSIIRSLLVRTAVLGKTAAAEPVLAPAFARALAAADPELGACVAVTHWPGGDEAVEAAALRRVGIVVHYGGADAVASLQARTPTGTRFVEHGPRISFAIVRPGPGHGEAGDEGGAGVAGPGAPSAAADLARAVALFDQQGCVSPQSAYVIGTRADAHAFAGSVARELGSLQRELPRGRLSAGEAAAVRELRAAAEFRAIAGAPIELWTGDGLDYTVILSDDVAFEGSCLNRTLVVIHAPRIEDVVDAVRPFREWLQTVGLAGFDGGERLDVAGRLAAAGATRITSIAAMPWPPMTWHHDGRGPLRELVTLVDLEE